MSQIQSTSPLPGTFDAGAFGLYATTVLVWGASWYAMTFQIGIVSPEVSVVWRFVIAAGIMFAIAFVRREKLGFPLAVHLRFAAVGATMFSTNFALFYHASHYLVTGLLAVVFSLTSVLNLLLAAVFFRTPVPPRVIAGAVLGAVGVGAMFWPEVERASFDGKVLTGLGFSVAATLSFSLGNQVSTAIQRARIPVFPANCWGMFYGMTVLAAFALAAGRPFVLDLRTGYILSLLYLAIFASVVAFACYVTLLRRIGSGRAGYATVMFPVIALLISTLFENYQWTGLALGGLALVLVGNLFVLRRA